MGLKDKALHSACIERVRGILCSLEKGKKSATCDIRRSLENTILSEISQPQKGTVRFHLHEVPKTPKLIEAESRMAVARGWGEGKMGSCRSKGITFQFLQGEQVLEICTASHLEFRILCHILKTLLRVYFLLNVLIPIKHLKKNTK